MGKIKKKPKRQHQSPDNPLGIEKHEDEPTTELENPVVANLLQNLISTDEEHRKCACTAIANLITQPGTLEQFLKKDVVRIVGPLILDPSSCVQKEALGTLRNISVSGEGARVCEIMVKQDVMTPIVALMQKYISASQEGGFQHDAHSIQIMTEAAHILWNLCESDEVAVKIFNQQSLHTVLMPLLKEKNFPNTLVLPVVQCLNTVTDDNAALCRHFTKDLTTLVAVLDWPQVSHSDLLIAMNVCGLLQNVTSCTDCEPQLYTHIMEKSISLFVNVLQIDLVPLVQKAVQEFKEAKSECIVSHHSTTNGAGASDKGSADNVENTEEQDEADMAEETSEEAKRQEKETRSHIYQNGPEKIVDDVHDLVKAQILAVTLISNLCCSEDDESWEDLGSSDGSLEDVSMDCESEIADSGDAMVSEEVLQLFSRHKLPCCVMSKCQPTDQTLQIHLASDRDTHSLLKSIKQVQVCSLVCLSNLLTLSDLSHQQQASDTADGILGTESIQFLQSAWQLLGPQLTSCRKTDTELLEAETLALRAVLERLGKADINLLQQVDESDLQFLCELTLQSSNHDTRCNLIRVVACIGCGLAKLPQPHPHLKGIGEFFCSICSSESQLWVIAECLDCIFDVFGEDHLNPILKEIHLIDKLQQIVPVLKLKVREQKASLGEHAAIVSTARTNLTRFIKYKVPLLT